LRICKRVLCVCLFMCVRMRALICELLCFISLVEGVATQKLDFHNFVACRILLFHAGIKKKNSNLLRFLCCHSAAPGWPPLRLAWTLPVFVGGCLCVLPASVSNTQTSKYKYLVNWYRKHCPRPGQGTSPFVPGKAIVGILREPQSHFINKYFL